METKLRKIPFSPPDISQAEIDEVVDTLKSGWITTGPKTKKFEELLSNYCRTNKMVCLNSATASLEMTLRVLGIGKGDEVITSAYTYTASASVINHVGAKIVLVDTATDSYQMDFDKIEKAITEKTKAIIPIDIAGVMCDYDKLFEIVRKKQDVFKPSNNMQSIFNRIIILADASHSFGASYKGKMSGEVADFTAFSFHAVKNLTTAEGGAVTWRDIPNIDNDYIYKQFMLLSLHGQSKDALEKTKAGSWEYDIIYPAYKCNMTDIMASIGIAQLNRYDSILAKRKYIIEIYNKWLDNCNVKYINHYGDNLLSSGHLYLVRLNDKDEQYRNRLIKKMSEIGISMNVHYKPLPMLTAYKNLGFDIKDFPNAYSQFCNEITLPLHTLLNEEDIYYIISNFTKEIKC